MVAPTGEAGESASAGAGEKTRPAAVLPAGVVPPQAEPAAEELTAAELAGPDLTDEESSRDVSPLAVAGIILGVIALVGVAAGVLTVLTHGFRPKTVVTVTYRPPAVFGLRPGQCVNSGSDALKVVVVSCAQPHDAEVFAAFTLPAAAWPGASAVGEDASNGCESRLGSYIDPQLATAGLTQEYVYPNQAAWQAGERTVVCEISEANGQLTGSVRAKG
jgi:Septum formation